MLHTHLHSDADTPGLSQAEVLGDSISLHYITEDISTKNKQIR